jgi:PAS domain S-box-containing protein
MSDNSTSTVWEKRFKETADLLPGIICEADRRMRVTYANEFAYQAFKYNADDIEKGVLLTELIHPDDLERAVGNVGLIFEGHTVGPQEYRLLHKDGTMSDYQVDSAPIFDGDELVGVRTCIFDISERKRAAEKLKRSEARFRRIFS